MAKKELNSVEEIRNLVGKKELVIGSNQILRGLRKSKLSRIFLASNCRKETVEDIQHYSKLAKAEVVLLDKPNTELGNLCKKSFSISAVGIMR